VSEGEGDDKIEIFLGPAPRVLGPNVRGSHWAQESRAARAYREQAFLVARSRVGCNRKDLPWPGAYVRATFYFRVRRKRDGDNLNASLKHALDGLADAGIVADDNAFVLLPPTVEIGDRLGVKLVVVRRPDFARQRPRSTAPTRTSGAPS